MNTRKLMISGLLVVLFFSHTANAQENRWSEERANNWYQSVGWLNGVNYIPSDALNYTAMWDKTSFNPKLIDKELALAESIGINSVRFIMQYAVYEDDPQYFLNTLDKFLKICEKHKIVAMPTFFDDCAFGTNRDPKIGKQPEPLEGWFFWAWSPSPGHQMVVDQREHPKLEKYVKDVLTRFKNDKRIIVWDLYNEPTNGGIGGKYTLPLVQKVFVWAREVAPSQPVTVAAWSGHAELNKIITDNSDVISFHLYSTKAETEKQIKHWKSFGRPVICTEWFHRLAGSTVADILPLFKEENVGSMLWGLVNGKSQAHLGWDHRPEMLPYTKTWKHDLYRGDFKPYDVSEIELIKELSIK